MAHPLTPHSAHGMGWGGVPANQALDSFMYKFDFCGGYSGQGGKLPKAEFTFNFDYRHTLPREFGNLAVLGPSSGYGGLGSGARRIMALNVSVGVSIAAALAEQHHTAMASIYSVLVAKMLERRGLIVGCLVR